jgi:ATP-dependent DNA helicase PIF1
MTNAEFDLAEQFALYTRKHCFITGKAGTGKTTLLRRIVERTQKNVVVVAPTGVAAINAGGVTIHSMFGLPLTCFIPGNDFVDLNLATNLRRLLHEHLHFRKEKQHVLREMDLLIIDEISMVRCDILDAIDFVLRTVRRNEQPFGGAQVLLFGDMHQLPPVVKDAEWNIMKAYYRSPYFFDSLVWPQLQAAEIELQTIYRQSDASFLSLLSHIRNRAMESDDYERLRERYDPQFKATEKGYILLSTHNYKADSVNESELAKLPGQTCSFEAQIEGEFPEHLFPCDSVLRLKAGAQVMFIRNDSEEGMYYNGKLAVVKQIDRENITVVFNDGGRNYTLHREKWENVNYSVEEESGEVVKQELGTFSQFPLRLAWAITIHKSQGLTFDKVIIDAGKSFAAGQVYVALSRCRSLEGIVLHSLISPSAIHGDQRIGEFSASHHSAGDLQSTFIREKTLYANYLLLRLFMFHELSTHLDGWRELITKKEIPDKDAAVELHARICAQVSDINSTAGKFQRELQQIIAAMESDRSQIALLKDRCAKAIRYFTGQIATQIIEPLHAHTNLLAYKKKVKRYLQHVLLIQEICWNRIDKLYSGQFLGERLYAGELTHTKDRLVQVVSSATSAKKEKGGTFRDTLDLHGKGKTAQEIAALRGLTTGTIKHHLARWIASGEINVHDVLPAETIEAVTAFMEQSKIVALGEIRSGLGYKYDYDDIRMIVSHVLRETKKSN